MKKYYTFGEILLTLRKEYLECQYLLDELKKHIDVKTDYNSLHFTGLLPNEDYPDGFRDGLIRLYIENRYNSILKKIEYFKYDWYSRALYSALFDVRKEENGLYKLEYNNIFTPVDGKKYIPEIQIVDQDKFSELVDKLYSTDLMQLKKGYFKINHDSISLDFDDAYIQTSLGDDSYIRWKGINDLFFYSITRHNCPMLIGDIFSLEIPADRISTDWLNLLERHESDLELNKEYFFSVDIDAQSKKGLLQVSEIDKNEKTIFVRLKKKKK